VTRASGGGAGRGNIYTKNPGPETVEKAVVIARHFNAKVRGDDGEVYPGGGEPYCE